MKRLRLFGFLFLLAFPAEIFAGTPESLFEIPVHGPRVLVLYDGADVDLNPGRQDALFLVNLLGHFTTRRTVAPLETYKSGEYLRYDAVFVVVFQKKYEINPLLLQDAAADDHIFCWLGNQVQQLEQYRALSRHGVRFVQFTDRVKFNRVTYKGRSIEKGDPEVNLLAIDDPTKAQSPATVTSVDGQTFPYLIRSANFWIVADSPFSYSSEKDRYLVFADVLHDILGINHAENHRAILRIEDINAESRPNELSATLQVIRKHHIPFAFGYVPLYVNPHERLDLRLSERPDVVAQLHQYARAGGVPVLHGCTHQYRGVTTDDYEFWDDLSDRPIRGDSERYIANRLDQAINESIAVGIYPVTWETPHYAASALDYGVIKRYFDTVFERRVVRNTLDSDQFFPYPVIDIYGQYVIPEDLAYIPIDDQRVEPLLQNADAAYVVRDGYASVFYHPFLPPVLLDRLIQGIKDRGFHFIDIRNFPNHVHSDSVVISNINGTDPLRGHGRFLDEFFVSQKGRESRDVVKEVTGLSMVKAAFTVPSQETYVAVRRDTRPLNTFEKMIRLAKGDVSILQRKWETAIAPQNFHESVKTVLLWDEDAKGELAIDQEGFANALGMAGFDVDKVDVSALAEEELGHFTLLVLPAAAARELNDDAVARILRALKDGMTIVTDGESALSQALGIQLAAPIPVTTLTSFLSEIQPTRWIDHPKVPWISTPTNSVVYYADREQGHPLVIGGDYGAGRYVFFSPLFDPTSGHGYSRFPNFPQILISEMHIRPLVWQQGLDAYFDPGYRQSISIEVLARMWHRFGIRTIHVAAWHFYDRYTYDYARLVKVAHQNGILVYAWFEWPEVSEHFWEQHPAWREKTALRNDAHVDWRFLMNLQDPDCLKALLKDTKNFLQSYDWDGTDIGELTFESPAGPAEPSHMTPFNVQARGEFKKLSGFDPLELFKEGSPNFWKTNPAALDMFYRYRRDVNARLLKIFLEEIQRINSAGHHQMEVIVTMLDALQHPELSDYIAIDVARTVELVNHFGATLQVEDPALDWEKTPERYFKMGERYKNVKLDRPYMIDINVLPVHRDDQAEFATAQPTGTELLDLWRVASSVSSRVCVYAESSIFEHDWEIMPYAIGSRATVQREGEQWVIKTPYTVQFDIGPRARNVRLDDQPWFCQDKATVIVPAGTHRLSATGPIAQRLFDTASLQTHLQSISGELITSQPTRRGLEVEYSSPQRCLLVFSKTPNKTFIDGKNVKLPGLKGDTGYTVIAPPGNHRLRVVTETVGSYLIEATSLVAASLIVLFGALSSGLLAILFLFIVVNRRLHHFRQIIWRRRKGHHRDQRHTD